ncbi:MAG TPA: DUF1269 domain-containing protein [Acetobacteraceae bacterium]
MHAQAQDSVVAVFPGHDVAEAAVKALTAAGIAIKAISIVGKGYHTEEKVLGFYNMGDRVKFWGSRGAFWGGLWGLFFGGMILTLPVTGPVVLVGYVAAAAVSAVEGALVVGGLSALGAALAGIGIPRDSVLRYETAIAADGFLVMAHGTTAEMAQAEYVLKGLRPQHLELHQGGQTFAAAGATDKQLAGMVV